MNFQEAIKSVLNNYANFRDRAPRSEFWYWNLFTFLLNMATSILDGMIFGMPLLNPISGLALLIPSIAVTVRRLHDVDRSGWWMLIAITIIGLLFPLLYWYCKKGDAGVNRFGANPLEGR